MANNKYVQEVKIPQEMAILKVAEECNKTYGTTWENKPYLNPTTLEIMCPPFFDSIVCWPPQLPNTTASVACPHYYIGFNSTHNATRRCNENAEWYTKDGHTFTNYYGCYDSFYTTVYTNVTREKQRDGNDISPHTLTLIKIISETGYVLSLVSLLIAFTIMFKLKKLHCARNIIHMNLFASFILKSFMNILKDVLFEDGVGLPQDLVNRNGTTFFHVDVSSNNFECKLIVSLVQYFAAANYSWILMEGVYLNNLILRALFTDSSKNLVYYISFGWGLPLIVVSAWVGARIIGEDSLCWTTNENTAIFMILVVPIFASVLVNLVLFVIISIVLYNKLKSPINENSRRYLKWAKSTLVLVPLFGVNYSFFLIFYILGETLVWIICNSIVGSFLGFFVAVLYCFLNGEVEAEIMPHITSLLVFLATNKFTKYCFPRREKYLSSAVGRQSVCTTMSCSSLYVNNGMHRNSKTKLEQLSKIKLTNFNGNSSNDLNPRHSVPKVGTNGHYVPNLTFVHGRHPLNMTTNLDNMSPPRETKPHHYSQNLAICEEEVSMLEDKCQSNI